MVEKAEAQPAQRWEKKILKQKKITPSEDTNETVY